MFVKQEKVNQKNIPLTNKGAKPFLKILMIASSEQ